MLNGNTLSKNYFLQKARDFSNVWAKPRRAKGEYATLVARENNLGIPRIGFLVAKRKVKKAVDRNKIKRLVKESFRLNKKTIANFDIIFLLNKEPDLKNSYLLSQELNRQWRKFASDSATR